MLYEELLAGCAGDMSELELAEFAASGLPEKAQLILASACLPEHAGAAVPFLTSSAALCELAARSDVLLPARLACLVAAFEDPGLDARSCAVSLRLVAQEGSDVSDLLLSAPFEVVREFTLLPGWEVVSEDNKLAASRPAVLSRFLEADELPPPLWFSVELGDDFDIVAAYESFPFEFGVQFLRFSPDRVDLLEHVAFTSAALPSARAAILEAVCERINRVRWCSRRADAAFASWAECSSNQSWHISVLAEDFPHYLHPSFVSTLSVAEFRAVPVSVFDKIITGGARSPHNDYIAAWLAHPGASKDFLISRKLADREFAPALGRAACLSPSGLRLVESLLEDGPGSGFSEHALVALGYVLPAGLSPDVLTAFMALSAKYPTLLRQFARRISRDEFFLSNPGLLPAFLISATGPGPVLAAMLAYLAASVPASALDTAVSMSASFPGTVSQLVASVLEVSKEVRPSRAVSM